MNENLDSIRRVHLIILGICLALFFLGLSPIESIKYQRALVAINHLPDVAVNDSEAKLFWSLYLENVHYLHEYKNRENSQLDSLLHIPTYSFIVDTDGNLLKIMHFTLDARDVKIPATKRVLDLTTLLDDFEYISRPEISSVSILNKIKQNVDTTQKVFITYANDSEYPGYFEKVAIKIKYLEGGIEYNKVLDSVNALSRGEGPIRWMTRYLYSGEIAPREYSTDEKNWRIYINNRQFYNDILPVFSEIKYLDRNHAIETIASELEKSKQSITLLGITINENLAKISAPLLLLLTLIFLLIHIIHLGVFNNDDLVQARLYPWPVLFDGAIGSISSFLMIFLIPFISLFLFLIRVWKTSEYKPNDISLWFCCIISALVVLVSIKTLFVVVSTKKRIHK